MRHLLPALLLTLICSTAIAGGGESVPGNLAQLDSCSRCLADSLLPLVAEGDTLLLPPLLGEVAPMLLAHLVSGAAERRLAVSSARCAEADPGIVSAEVLYHSLDNGTSQLRESRVTVEIAPRARCAAPLSEYRILTAVLRDTVASRDTAALADVRVAASRGRAVESDDTGWLAPVLVIGAVLLSTILLFTVRSQ